MSELLAIRNLSKRFGGTTALDDVSLDIAGGEVHALLGHNGSGKSTLIKILSGYHGPDAGSVSIRGEQVRLPLTAAEVRRNGLAFTHQDLGLIPSVSVMENLLVGRFQTRAGRINWRTERRNAADLLARFGLPADPDDPVARLTQTQRAILAIIRALRDVEDSGDHGLLVLDEPTASLPEHEVELLFDAVRRVTATGSAVLFVTHKLSEVMTIAHRVSILRDGRLIATEPVADLDERRLIRLIVGAELGELYPTVERPHAKPVMEVSEISGDVAHSVSFELHEGEILGLTGLVGAGHDEVPYLIFGAASPSGGTITVGGVDLSKPTPQRAKAAGVALLPADRQRQATIAGATVRENVTVATLGRYVRHGVLQARSERRDVRRILDRFAVRPVAPERLLSTLSGGNQQKALLGRWVEADPIVLLLHEPTQGIDVGACKGIFEILRSIAADGTAVVYSSNQYADLVHLCHRVLVFNGGRVVSELSGDALTEDRIVEQSYAGSAAAMASPRRAPAPRLT